MVAKFIPRCNIRYGKRVTGIDLKACEVHFSDGSGTATTRLSRLYPFWKR